MRVIVFAVRVCAMLVLAVLCWWFFDNLQWALVLPVVPICILWWSSRARPVLLGMAVLAAVFLFVPAIKQPFPRDWLKGKAGQIAGKARNRLPDQPLVQGMPGVSDSVPVDDNWLAAVTNPEVRAAISQALDAGHVDPKSVPRHPDAVASDIIADLIADINKSDNQLAVTMATASSWTQVQLKGAYRRKADGSYILDSKLMPPVWRQIHDDDGDRVWIIDPTFQLHVGLEVFANFGNVVDVGLPVAKLEISQMAPPEEQGKPGECKIGYIDLHYVEYIVPQSSFAIKTLAPVQQQGAFTPPPPVEPTWPTKEHPKSAEVIVKTGTVEKMNEWTWTSVIPDEGERFSLKFSRPVDPDQVLLRIGWESKRKPVPLAYIQSSSNPGEWESTMKMTTFNKMESSLGLILLGGENDSVEVEIAKI